MRSKILTGILAALVTTASLPVSAHHSFAMFDNKSIVLTGTVRNYEWTNPHTWLWLYVTAIDGKPVSDNGQPQIWGLEGTSPGELTRHGGAKNDFKVGDKIKATVRPLKSGQRGGSLGRVELADGRVIGGWMPGGPGAPGAAPVGPPPGRGTP